jgi:hypothetical protein
MISPEAGSGAAAVLMDGSPFLRRRSSGSCKTLGLYRASMTFTGKVTNPCYCCLQQR